MRTSNVDALSDEVAVLTSSGTILKSGTAVQKYTWTAVFRRSRGTWKIASAHEAFSDLEPTVSEP